MEGMDTDKQTIPCDVVLLPEGSQATEAIRCSELLAMQGGLFRLDNEYFYAHASLYMFKLAVGRLAECTEALKVVATKHSTQELTPTGYTYLDKGPGKGFVDIAFDRTEEADQLQQDVLAALAPLRSGMVEIIAPMLTNATGVKLENLQQYGYPAVGELFRPHITLTKFPAETEPDLSVLPSPEVFTGKFTKIGLFEMGANGTCIRPLAVFDL